MHRLLVTMTALVAALVLAGGAGAWTWPAEGAVLRPFQLGADAYAGGQHRGLDVAGQEGSPVRAPAAGLVTFAGSVPTHGRGVTIATGDGYSVTLVHLGTIAVSKGDSVAEGAAVGVMGTSGEAEHAEPSVHLGIRRMAESESYVDPIGLLPARPTAPVSAPPSAPAPAPAPSPAPPVAVAPATPPAAAPAPSPAPAPAPVAPAPAPTPPPTAAPAVVPVVSAPDAGVVVSETGASGEAPFVVRDAGRPEPRVVDRLLSSARLPAQAAGPTADAVPESRALSRGDVSPRSTARVGSTTVAVASASSPVDARVPRLAPGASGQLDLRAAKHAPTPEPYRVRASAGGSPERVRGAPPRAAAAGVRPVDVPGLGDARAASGEGSTVAAKPTADHGLDPTPVVLAVGLAFVAAGMAAWKAARRIGGRGALLPDNTDLLRERDPAHRSRVHDRGRGHLRPAPAAARS